MKESQGVKMMYKLLQCIETKRQYVFSSKDYNHFHTCIEIYETYLAKTSKPKLVETLDKYSKKRIKQELRAGLKERTSVQEKMQCLYNVMYILANFKANKDDT